MDTGSIVIAIVAIVFVTLVVASIVRFAGGPRLRSLSGEARTRFVNDWNRIEARFVDGPAEAVRQADDLVMSLLRARQHPVEEDRLPSDLRQARHLAATQQPEGFTEALRQSMLHYRAVLDDMVGKKQMRERVKQAGGRREVA